MTRFPAFTAVAALFLIVTGCAPGPASSTGGSGLQPTVVGPKVITVPITREVSALHPQINTAGGTDAVLVTFNAGLSYADETGIIHPSLAELPQLNTDTWQVLPDGKMETKFNLRPGLTWQDGTPFDAQDFVFATRVYSNPNVPIRNAEQIKLMDSVVAPDSRTLVIRWKSLYQGAGSMQMLDFVPLPRHILEQPLSNIEKDPAQADAFVNLPFWKAEYVSVGPFRLRTWEPGSVMEGTAFDGYVLGRPKIDRIVIRIMDDTTVMTNILAGTLDIGETNFEQHQVLERDWVAAGKGFLRQGINNPRPLWIQLKPEYVGEPAILDLRVRRALAYSVDRQAINDGVFDGEGAMTETIVPTTAAIFPDVDKAIMHYPYDPRRSEQLMTEVGYTRDRDGFFIDASGKRFVLDFERDTDSEQERIQQILVDRWQKAGFQINAYPLPVAAPLEHRATFPGIQGTGGASEASWASATLATAANRWGGTNKGGWTSLAYDRLYDSFNSTLDQAERTRLFIQMQVTFTENLPMFLNYFNIKTWAIGSHMKNWKPEVKPVGGLTQATLRNWNIHEWERQ